MTKSETMEQDALFDEWWRDTVKCGAYSENDKDRDFLRKRYARFVRLSNGGIVGIDRPSIETSFCCGEDDRGQGGEGYGTMAYALKTNAEKRTEEGFKSANLNAFDNEWRRYVKPSDNERVFATCQWWQQNKADEKPVAQILYCECSWNVKCTYRDEFRFALTDGDRRIIADAVQSVRDAYAKRLDAYWKRFGASKIRTWTYWTEA